MLRAMPLLSVEERTRLGLRAAGSQMYQLCFLRAADHTFLYYLPRDK